MVLWEERLRLPLAFVLGLVSVIVVTVVIATAEVASVKDESKRGVKANYEKRWDFKLGEGQRHRNRSVLRLSETPSPVI